MTVRELLERLEQIEPDANVRIGVPGHPVTTYDVAAVFERPLTNEIELRGDG